MEDNLIYVTAGYYISKNVTLDHNSLNDLIHSYLRRTKYDTIKTRESIGKIIEHIHNEDPSLEYKGLINHMDAVLAMIREIQEDDEKPKNCGCFLRPMKKRIYR